LNLRLRHESVEILGDHVGLGIDVTQKLLVSLYSLAPTEKRFLSVQQNGASSYATHQTDTNHQREELTLSK
jgi:hypothetical protein